MSLEYEKTYSEIVLHKTDVPTDIRKWLWFLQLCKQVKLYICIIRVLQKVNDFSQKFATRWGRPFRPPKVYTFLVSITRRVDLAMSVSTWPSLLAIAMKPSQKLYLQVIYKSERTESDNYIL